ncbi:hypothetical protein DPMN_066725 [Dreissena polymorpha]|uniref:Uncharacterized protein n=1 Tax=Dreissena polymorpha TaxID=45954 RepID=A0A9D3YZJ9_DREPO|nr:hypothetical protein DPMN_066725 [Dreissena polymorpha]
MRDGHRRLITRELERFDSTELTTSEYERLLHLIMEEAEEVRTLNDKIVSHNDIEDLSSELVEGKSYSFDLELKIQRLRDNLNKRIGNKEEITSNVSQDETNSGQPEPDRRYCLRIRRNTAESSGSESHTHLRYLPRRR